MNMKKLLFKILCYSPIAIAVLVYLIFWFNSFSDIILKIGNGSMIAGILITPFVVIGAINVLRGIGYVLEVDAGKADHHYNSKIGWQFYVYAIYHWGGYIALFYILFCLD